MQIRWEFSTRVQDKVQAESSNAHIKGLYYDVILLSLWRKSDYLFLQTHYISKGFECW